MDSYVDLPGLPRQQKSTLPGTNYAYIFSAYKMHIKDPFFFFYKEVLNFIRAHFFFKKFFVNHGIYWLQIKEVMATVPVFIKEGKILNMSLQVLWKKKSHKYKVWLYSSIHQQHLSKILLLPICKYFPKWLKKKKMLFYLIEVYEERSGERRLKNYLGFF